MILENGNHFVLWPDMGSPQGLENILPCSVKTSNIQKHNVMSQNLVPKSETFITNVTNLWVIKQTKQKSFTIFTL